MFNPAVAVDSSNYTLDAIPSEVPDLFSYQISQQKEQIYKAASAVARLRVTYKTRPECIPQQNWVSPVIIPTTFAVAKNILFTNWHCMPSIFYSHKATVVSDRVGAYFTKLHTLDGAYLKQTDPVPKFITPLRILSNEDLMKPPIVSIDPISGNPWARSREEKDYGSDIVAATFDDQSQWFENYLLPSAKTPEVHSTIFSLGFPQIRNIMTMTARVELERIYTLMVSQGVDFLEFLEYKENSPQIEMLKRMDRKKREKAEVYKQMAYGLIAANQIRTFKNDQLNLTYGKILPRPDDNSSHHTPLLPTDCSSVVGCSGSPHIDPQNPMSLLGMHVGASLSNHPNGMMYNLFMSVDHPEFVLKWVTFALPALPETDYPKIAPYLNKHLSFLIGAHSKQSFDLKLIKTITKSQ
eukprot:TRINITY_DN9937_c0_g1_i1.p1 TRINITY_DN9937_c0_g1~~TRINITY_DN9937_c0_g1_i1.p1  ORF type:complete len:466 (-),score=64.10 TRINITY_DN9937_c0_g1_i1:52-1281(-)